MKGGEERAVKRMAREAALVRGAMGGIRRAMAMPVPTSALRHAVMRTKRSRAACRKEPRPQLADLP